MYQSRLGQMAEVIDRQDQAHRSALLKLVNAVNAYQNISSEGPVEALSSYVSECEWEYFLAYREYQNAMSELTK